MAAGSGFSEDVGATLGSGGAFTEKSGASYPQTGVDRIWTKIRYEDKKCDLLYLADSGCQPPGVGVKSM